MAFLKSNNFPVRESYNCTKWRSFCLYHYEETNKEFAMERTWSEELKNTTREIAGTGCMLQSILPTEEVIATFSNLEAMIEAGWVVD